jgi:hypothetical protein
MYQNRHGRFTAVDPLMASASPINPQTFNRYIYTGNNPINYTDPSGLDYYRDKDGNLVYKPGSDEHEGLTNITALGQPVTIARGGCFDDPARGCVTEGATYIFGHDSFGLAGDRTIEPVQIAISFDEPIIKRSFYNPLLCTTGDCVPNLTPEQKKVSQDILDTASIILTLCGFVVDICDAASGAIDGINGDPVGAASSLPSAIPGAGVPFGATKILRKVDRLLDSASSGKTVDKVENVFADANKVNGNSLDSEKAQHVYEIFETANPKKVVKTGISDGKITQKGKSYRAEKQVRKWNRAEGQGKYSSRISKSIPKGTGARRKALKAERKNADKHRTTLDPRKHKRP